MLTLTTGKTRYGTTTQIIQETHRSLVEQMLDAYSKFEQAKTEHDNDHWKSMETYYNMLSHLMYYYRLCVHATRLDIFENVTVAQLPWKVVQ